MLSGTVPSLWLKQKAIDKARKTDDVTSVVSELSVMKAESDDILANEIATRVRRYAFYTIYDDIDGRVHDGVVTLTGKVTSPHKASDIADLVGEGCRRARGRQSDRDAAGVDLRRPAAATRSRDGFTVTRCSRTTRFRSTRRSTSSSIAVTSR